MEEKPDTWHPREAQSDFLDIGEQAGIEWLSFVPQDQQKYPELFEGLDKDQKDRLRLAPRESNDRVLLHFDLPEGSKLWPVDWYGTELMAIDIQRTNPERTLQCSLALAKPSEMSLDQLMHNLALERFESGGGKLISGADQDAVIQSGNARDPSAISSVYYTFSKSSKHDFAYVARRLTGRTGSWMLVLEVRQEMQEPVSTAKDPTRDQGILNGISIKRELALEGSPKHKVRSSLDELLGGTLHFPEGTLKLPIQDGYLVRKTGGDSTIQVDGKGAEPWILIRRLDETELEGDLRVRVRNDTAFKRRLKVASANFGRGRQPGDAKLPIVMWSYADSSAGQQLLGIMKAGNEILNFEVVSTGLRDLDQRRAAFKAAVRLLTNASGEPATEAPEFEPLVGWNVGTMGRDE